MVQKNIGLRRARIVFEKKKGGRTLPGFKTSCEVKVAQSCLTLCDPMDYTVHGVVRVGHNLATKTTKANEIS